MRQIILLILGLMLLGGGCAARVETVTPGQLRATLQSHAQESVESVSYAGTGGGYHYVVLSRATDSRMYRVPVSEMVIEDPFPVTSDKARWRALQQDLQPMPHTGDSATANTLNEDGR